MIVYLAGCKGTWREKFKSTFPNTQFIDPFVDSRQSTLVDFVKEDLEYIKKADLIIGYVGYSIYTGLSVEIGYAAALGKPIIIIWELRKGRVEPLIIGLAQKIFVDVDSAIDRLKGELK